MEESDLWIPIFVFVFEGPEPQERVAVVDEEAEEILVKYIKTPSEGNHSTYMET